MVGYKRGEKNYEAGPAARLVLLILMYSTRRRPKQRRRSWRWLVTILLLIGIYTGWALLRPVPAIQATVISDGKLTVQTPNSRLAWPAGIQSAAGLVGSNQVQTSGPDKPAPTASTAKIITALVVLEKKPLGIGQSGPSIMMTAADEESYRSYLARGGSVTPVKAGVALTEYQALQAVMLPSANNVADSLAIWAFGSLPEYRQAANDYLQRHKLNNTKVGSDASGLSADTVSTARDLVQLGKLALEEPVLVEIMKQPEATNYPVAGTIRNVNHLLGVDGINGIKTGNSDEAGGAFVGSAQIMINNQSKTLVTAILGGPNRPQVMRDSLLLIKSGSINFESVSIVQRGDRLGSYYLPWGGSVPVVAAASLEHTVWNGSQAEAKIRLASVSPPSTLSDVPFVHTAAANQTASGQPGQKVGKVSIDGESVEAELAAKMPAPPIWWRLTHPF